MFRQRMRTLPTVRAVGTKEGRHSYSVHISAVILQGRHIFKAALDDGSAESFFPLVQHFTTQNEPASCALGTLCMVCADPDEREFS